jgi:hypothetical protein
MPVTASTTEEITSTGVWTLLASGGAILVTGTRLPHYAFTTAATPPDEALSGHPFKENGARKYLHDATLPDGLYFWVRVLEGVVLTVTATEPAE